MEERNYESLPTGWKLKYKKREKTDEKVPEGWKSH